MHFPWKRERGLYQLLTGFTTQKKVKGFQFRGTENRFPKDSSSMDFWWRRRCPGSLAEFHVRSGGSQCQRVSPSPFEPLHLRCPGSKSVEPAASRPSLGCVMDGMWQEVDGRQPGHIGFSTWRGQVPREALPSWVNAFRWTCWCQGNGGQGCV